MRLLIAFIIISFGTVTVAGWSNGASQAVAGKPRTPVMVELFTSEGCSSCPPADAFLTALESQQPVPGAQVIALEEHVDYWDQLGWRDPFSSADWTERQRRYVDVLARGGGPYTPQMVVNGSVEFVGSRDRTGTSAIEQAATRAAIPVDLSVTATPGKRSAEVAVQVGSGNSVESRGDLEVWVALAESRLQSSVSRGENAGKQLRHASVLRKLQKVGSINSKSLGQGQTTKLAARVNYHASWKPENLHVVAFIQDRRNLRILGAAQAPLQPST